MRAESRSTPTNPPGASTPSRSSMSSVKSPVAPINSHQSQRSRARLSSSQSRWAASRRTRRFPSRHSALAGLTKASCLRSERDMISCGPFLVDELDDRGYQLGGDHHHCLIFLVQGGFDFRDRLFVGLVV